MRPFNLLPPANKTFLRWNARTAQVQSLSVYVLLLVIASGFFLYIGKYILQEHNATLSREVIITPENEDGLSLADINRLNQMIEIVSKKAPFSYRWSELLLELSQVTPPNVHLSHFEADISASKALLQGTADSREALLDFKSRIEGSPLFADIAIPPDVLTQPTNIPFFLETTIETPSYEQ